MRLRERPRLPPRSKLDTIKRCMILFPCVFQRIWQLHFVRNALLMALHRRRSSSRRSSSSCSSNGVAVLLQYRLAESPLLSQILRLYSCHLDQKGSRTFFRMSCFLFCLFTRFELATRGSKCVAFGRNSPGDCFAASALYLCDRLPFFSSGAALFLRRCSTYCSTW